MNLNLCFGLVVPSAKMSVYEQLWKSSYDRNNNKKNYQNHSLSTFQVVYNLDLKMVNKKGLGECLLSQQCHKLLYPLTVHLDHQNINFR